MEQNNSIEKNVFFNKKTSFKTPITSKDDVFKSCNERLAAKKPTAKFIVVSKIPTSRRNDIAIITTDFDFYLYTINFKKKLTHLSDHTITKLRKIFGRNFNIDATTSIAVQDSVRYNNPLKLYLDIISMYSKADMSNINMVSAIKRIYYRHNNFRSLYTRPVKFDAKQVLQMSKRNRAIKISRALNLIWESLILLDCCPWITKSVNEQLLLEKKTEYIKQRRVRILLYYMFAKQMYVNYFKKFKLNHIDKYAKKDNTTI